MFITYSDKMINTRNIIDIYIDDDEKGELLRTYIEGGIEQYEYEIIFSLIMTDILGNKHKIKLKDYENSEKVIDKINLAIEQGDNMVDISEEQYESL